MNYLLAAWALLTSLVASVCVLWLAVHRRANRLLSMAYVLEMKKENDEMNTLISSVEEARSQCDNLAAKNTDLAALNADLADALTECQHTCMALQRQTIETVIPKRNNKGQFIKKVESNG